VVLGLSSKMTPAEQAFAVGHAWESLPEPKRQFVLQIVHPDGKVDSFRIGPHTPTMMNEDVLLLHRLWLNITREPGLENVHHHEILTEALTRFAHDYAATRPARDHQGTSPDYGRRYLESPPHLPARPSLCRLSLLNLGRKTAVLQRSKNATRSIFAEWACIAIFPPVRGSIIFLFCPTARAVGL